MKTKAYLLPLRLLAFALLAAATTGRAQTVLNSSFEDPATVSLVDGGGNDWTATGNTEIISNSFGRGTPTPFGTQFLYLRPSTSDAQTISGFTLGQAYQITLGVAFYNATSGTVTLSVSGGATASQSYATPTSSSSGFVTDTLSFMPTASTSVTFTVGSASTTNGSFEVDNVQIVPEPGTWALLGLGAGGLGLALRRQRPRAQIA